MSYDVDSTGKAAILDLSKGTLAEIADALKKPAPPPRWKSKLYLSFGPPVLSARRLERLKKQTGR